MGGRGIGGSGLLLAWLGTATALAAAPSIRIVSCRVTPDEVAPGGEVSLQVTAEVQGTTVANGRLRTPYRVGPGETPRGFAVEAATGCAVLADPETGGHLLDNGPHDRDPAKGGFTIAVPLGGLQPGVHYLTFFVHNRPAAEPVHAVDYRNLEVTVTSTAIRVRVLAAGDTGSDPFAFMLPGPDPDPAGRLVLGLRRHGPPTAGLAVCLRPPYTWAPAEVLPGFTYDAATRLGYLEDGPDHQLRDQGPHDRDPEPGSLRVELDTTGWPPGVHSLAVEVAAPEIRRPYGGQVRVYRDFQVRVRGPADSLQVTVGSPIAVGPGTHFSALVSLGDGRVTTGSQHSADGGRTWTTAPAPHLPRPNRLADGSLMALSYVTAPVADTPGHYLGQLFRAAGDGSAPSGPAAARFIVPEAAAGLGHALHQGPLVGRSLVELPDGTLLAGMYGWFVQDREPDRYRQGGTMRRAYVCRSRDRGARWEYLSTIAREPYLGNEGYSEVVLRRLPEGEILALVRTGGNNTDAWQDNPLVACRSRDDGQTWTAAARTGVEGVWPDLAVLQDGTLVASTGRPGAFIMFSRDQGRTWTDHTPIDPERYSGYTAVCELAPGELLVGYGVRQGLDPRTGRRRDGLWVVPVHVRPR